MIKYLTLLFLLSSFNAFGQAANADQMFDDQEDDLSIDGDIFSDFNEDLEASQIMEHERYYRYGRFFAVNLGLGYTSFTGNRGAAYTNNNPSFHISTTYFFNFNSAVVIGVDYSKHTMVLNTKVNISPTDILGAVETSFLRPFVGFRYYLDTADLGTAITYSNPYFIGKFEYWYQTNKFIDQRTRDSQKGGGVGTGIGGGLEFPIELKVSYVSVELMYHVVNFFDKYTQDYRKVAASKYGYDDLTGDVVTLLFTYNFTW